MASTPTSLRWRVGATSITIALILAAATTWWLLSPKPEAAAAPQTPNTVPAISAPLQSTLKTTGTIGFANTRDFAASRAGVLTSLPAPGTVVAPGNELYRLDDSPTMLLRGVLPAWRDFAPGMSNGADVKQLEQNLADLGLFDGTVDNEFTAKTSDAIRRWQKALGVPKDGTLLLGSVVFTAEDLRIGEPTARIGDSVGPGTVLYPISGAQQVITASIPAVQAAEVATGMPVSIALPGGATTTGTVTAIGPITEEKDANENARLVVRLTVAPDDPASLTSMDRLTAQLSISEPTDGDVLQVPVEALIATGDNAFAVEVLKAGKTSTVPVETGRFVGGMVEVTGGKLKAGDKVVVPG